MEGMAMTLRLSDEQTEALRKRAEVEGRSMQQVVLAAVDDYLARHSADEDVRRLGAESRQRWRTVLDRLGE
jgi:predicted transcriptional regulator